MFLSVFHGQLFPAICCTGWGAAPVGTCGSGFGGWDSGLWGRAGLRDQCMDLGCSRPMSALHKPSEITCLVCNISLPFPDLRQTLDLTEIRFCCVCSVTRNSLSVAQPGFLGRDLQPLGRDGQSAPDLGQKQAQAGCLSEEMSGRAAAYHACLSPGGWKNLWSLKLLPCIGSVSWVFPVLSPLRLLGKHLCFPEFFMF